MAAKRWDHLIYSMAVVLPRLPAFLLLPAIASILSLADMGRWATCWVFIELFQTIAGLGLKASLGRFFPIAQSQEERKEILTATLLGIFLGSITLGLISWLLFNIPFIHLNIQFFSAIDLKVFTTLLLTSLVGNLSSTFIIYFRAEQKAWTFFITSLIGAFLEFTLILFLYKTNHINLLSLLLIELLKQTIMLLFISYQGRRDLGFTISPKTWRRLLAFGSWMVPVGLSEWLITGSDRFWLGQESNLTQVGIYGFLYKFAMPLGILFTGSLMDYHARLYRMPNEEGLKYTQFKLGQFLGRYGFLMLSFALMVPIAFHGLLQLYPIIPKIYLSGMSTFPIMVAVIYTFYWAKFYAMILEYRFKPKSIMISMLTGAITTILLIPLAINLAQMRNWNILSATAYGALVSQLIIVAILGWISEIPGGKKSAILGLCFVSGCILASWIIQISF